MLRNRIIVFIYFLLLSGTYSSGQDYELNHIEKSHGLSNSYITSLFQDSKGMIWIGTMLGLNRYDGHQIKAYTADQTKKNKLRGNYIIGVNEDMYGTLWVSSSEGLALFDPLFNEFEYLQDYSAEIQPGIVSKTLMDGRGQIWFHQKVDGKPALFYLNTSEKLSKKMRSGKLSASDFNINKIQLPPDFGDRMMHIGLQSDNQLLLAGDNGIFYLFNTDNKVFKKVDINNYVITLNDGTKILKSVNNLNSTIIFSNYTFKETMSLSQMAEVLWLPDGRQLLARYYDKNLYDITHDIKTGEKISLPKIQNKIVLKDPQSIARIVDKAGNIWVGTAGNGLYLYKLVEGFKLYAKGSIFYNIEEIKPGHIWQGIFDKSQTLHIPSGKMVAPLWDALLPKNTRVLAAKRSAKSNKLYLMCHEGDQAKMILYEYDLSLNQLKKTNLELTYLDLPLMLEDKTQNIWVVGNTGETAEYNTKTAEVKYWNFSHLFPENKRSRLLPRSMTLSDNGSVWCSLEEGIISMQKHKDTILFQAYHNYTEKGVLFSAPGVSSIFPDPSDSEVIWIGSQGSGLCRFHTKKYTVDCYHNDIWNFFDVRSIQSDTAGHLWITTERGLHCFDLNSLRFIGFKYKDILSRYEYNPTSVIRSLNGMLCFGTWDGLLEIEPSKLMRNTNSSDIHISEILINGKVIENYKDILKKSNNGQLIISLHHLQNNVLLRFVTPGSQSFGGSTFEFRVPEYSPIWVPADAQGAVHLNGLAPGSYTIELRRTESLSNMNSQAELKALVVINYPWYWSLPLKIIYILLGITLLFYFIKLQKEKIEKNYIADLQKKEIQQFHFVDQFRKRFTTYLTHEFKTPLTIIIGIAELIKQNMVQTSPVEYLNSIQKEGNEMMDLVDEMMNIMKLEEGIIQIKKEYTDLNSFLKMSVSGFIKIAKLKQVDILLSLPEKAISLNLDTMRTKFILNNLISNSLKYTPKGGFIKIEAKIIDKNFVEIKITDNGSGIPEDALQYIFDKYYQVNPQEPNNRNFGLGLTFVKELVEALGGIIKAKSKPDHETTFLFTLPLDDLDHKSSLKENNYEISIFPGEFTEAEENIIKSNKPLLLICDDNPNILSYLEIFLGSYFNVIKATNGKEGLDTAIELVPDLILTDINMPVMDGLKMTTNLKSHNLTCHIPVIMLTGKTDIEDKIEGRKSGANAFIVKPFDYRELLLTLQNQYNLLQKWKEKYAIEVKNIIEQNSVSGTEKLPEIEVKSNEFESDQTDSFLANLMEALENNYHLEQFDTNQLCKILLISRTQLYRKLSTISEESPMEILRNFRLQKAALLLRSDKNISIQEVVNKVGFKERTHFNAVFHKKFNISPSEWRKNG